MKLKALALLTLIFFAGCTAKKEVFIGVHPWIGYQPINIASAKAILPPHILLKENKTATETKAQFLSGEIDAGYLTLDETLTLIDQGVDLKVVLVTDISFGADKVLAKNQISSKEDVLGKKVGYEKGAVGELVLNAFITEYDLNVKDIELVNTPYDQQFDAWKKQELDYLISYAPVATQILNLGAAEVFSSRDMPNMVIDVLAVKESFLKNNCSTVNAIVDSHFEGLWQLRHSFQDSSYLVADNLGISQRDVILTMNDIILPDRAQNANLIEKRLEEKIPKIAEVLMAAGLISKLPSNSIVAPKCLL